MSAETIPADVLSAAREALAAEFECSVKAFPASPARARRGEMDHTYELKAIVRAILTDRSTRPAETAAPVAEAGDGKVAVSLAHLNIGYLYGIADALERTYPTRAGDIRQCLLQVAKGLSASAATLEAERARADAAEQRAADALARAEKAEEALETAREERKAASEAMRHVGAHFPECAAEFDAIMDRNAARASREAQPATDGGDNG